MWARIFWYLHLDVNKQSSESLKITKSHASCKTNYQVMEGNYLDFIVNLQRYPALLWNISIFVLEFWSFSTCEFSWFSLFSSHKSISSSISIISFKNIVSQAAPFQAFQRRQIYAKLKSRSWSSIQSGSRISRWSLPGERSAEGARPGRAATRRRSVATGRPRRAGCLGRASAPTPVTSAGCLRGQTRGRSAGRVSRRDTSRGRRRAPYQKRGTWRGAARWTPSCAAAAGG